MIKLKGNSDDKNSIMASAAKHMGMPTVDRETGHVSIEGKKDKEKTQRKQPTQHRPAPTPTPSAINTNHSNMVFMKGGDSMKSHDDDPEGEDDDAPPHPKKSQNDNDDEDDDDLFFDGDDDAKALRQFHEKRLAEIRHTVQKQSEFSNLGHREYQIITEEEFLPTVTKSKFVVIHFFHKDFERCKIIDKHLTLLAQKHGATKFASLDAEKCPFFIGKLQVKMLPTVILFKDGIAVDRIIGFEELGGKDDFSTRVLEHRIEKSGILITKDKMSAEQKENERDKKSSQKQNSKFRKSNAKDNVIDDDDEEEDEREM